MNSRFTLCAAGVASSLIFLCSCATKQPTGSSLPAVVPINKDAGRGGFLIVTVGLETGEKLPFIVDTGASGSLIDKSLAPILGNPIGTVTSQRWGVIKTNHAYNAPKFFLGGVPLTMTGPAIIAYDCKNELPNLRPQIMGLLGMDVLEHYCIQLDFAAGRMRFLQAGQGGKEDWGKAFPIVELNSNDARPAVAENLLGMHGPHSLIDVGCVSDGWLMPKYFDQWTNQTVAVAKGEACWPNGYFDGDKYPFVSLARNDVESDGIGLRFLARHLVTLDFPNHTLYLKRQTAGPLSDSRLKATAMPALDPLIGDVLQNDVDAARKDLSKVERGRATELEKNVARNLEATLEDTPKSSPADVLPSVTQMPLGDCRPDLAEVGWLQPAANRIPLNNEITSPLMDSGKIFATGLFAHAPSKYVYNLDGKWKTLRGAAGLHSAFQGRAYGVVFIIETDGKEVFRSSAIRGSEHVHYDVDVKGVKSLELVVKNAQEQNGGNWGLWLEPALFR